MSGGWQNTLPGRLYRMAEQEPERIAMREKREGIWNGISWGGYLCQVAALARELEKLLEEQEEEQQQQQQPKPQEYIGIYGEDTVEWIFAELAAQLLGVVPLGIHPVTYEEELLSACKESQLRIIICGDQEQVDRAIAVGKNHSSLVHIVAINSRGTYHYREDKLLRYHELVKQISLEEAKDWFMARLKRIDPDMLALGVSSNGTADLPHTALFKHSTILSVARDFSRIYEIDRKDKGFCSLPLCHYIEQLFSVALPLECGLCPHIVESNSTVIEDLQAVSPSVVVFWASFWNRLRLMVLHRISLAGLLRGFFFDLFLDRGVKKVQLRPGKRLGILDRLAKRLGDILFFRALHNRLGLRSCRLALSACGEIRDYTLQWFIGLGIPLVEIYGLSETLGAGFANEMGNEKVGTSGKPLERLEYRFDSNREILVRGPYACDGLLFTSQKLIDEYGWIRSGDFGQLDNEKRLLLTGNRNYIVRNMDQEVFSIKRTEELLRANEYIREVICIADQRPFVTALIELHFERVADEILVEGGRFKYYEELVKSEAARALIASEIKIINEQLISIEKIEDFRFFPQELDEERGELSFDYSPRRRVIERSYQQLLQEMYS